MAVRNTYYCDATGKKMDSEQVLASERSRAEFMKQYPAVATEGLFAPEALLYAPDYWMEYSALLVDLQKEMKARLEKHRRSFFGKRLDVQHGS